MTRIIILFLSISVSSIASSQSGIENVYMFSYFKGNGDGLHYAYSNDGYTWKALFDDSIVLRPALSKDKLMRDPCIIRGGDGKFHMVWTVSWSDKGIGYASSPDLVNWSAQKYIPVMEYEPTTTNAWAPEITYDPKEKRYLIYWASTIPGRFLQKDTSAEGGKNNHRIYYVTTKDFKKFSKTKLLYDPGFSVIDASILKVNSRYVMFLKNETRSPVEKNLRVAFAKKLTGPYTNPGSPITGNYWAEGPSVLRIGDQWIVYFDKYRDHVYGAVTSADLINWTDISDKIKMPKGIRHGSVFIITQKEFQKLSGIK
jgi:predicted GH43/DUF377 family glycosyl hydrolase